MPEHARMPRLVLPFSIVGAAAGWLSAGFLSNPFIAIVEPGHAALTSAVACGVAAVVGVMLTRWCEPAAPWQEPTLTRARLVGAVVAGGAATGGVVSALVIPTLENVLAGACSGAAAGACFVPTCAVVVAAAKRARRARLGSLVAASDRRAVWAILASALALTTSAASLDWPFAGRPFYEAIAAPRVALGMLAVAAIVIAAAVVADARALRRTRTEGLEGRDPERASDQEAARRLDLGLGEGLLVALAPGGAAAYRSRERAVALVLGDPVEARTALRRAIHRGLAGLAVVGLAVGTHAAVCARARAIYPGDVVMVRSLGRAIDRALVER